jgi:hypothetical protein
VILSDRGSSSANPVIKRIIHARMITCPPGHDLNFFIIHGCYDVGTNNPDKSYTYLST